MANTFNIENFTIVLADGVLSASADFTKGQVLIECIPIDASAQHAGTFNESYASSNFDVELVPGPNRVQITRPASDGELIVSLTVMWCDPAQVTIQTGTVSIPIGTTFVDVPVTAIDQANTLISGFSTAPTDAITESPATMQFEDDSNLRVIRDETTTVCSGHWWIAEAIGASPEWFVQYINFITFGAPQPADEFSTLPTPVVVANSKIMTFGGSLSNSHDADRVGWNVNLTDPTTITHNQGDAFASSYVLSMLTVESESFSVQSGLAVIAAGDLFVDVPIAPVNLSRSNASSGLLRNGMTLANTSAALPQTYARLVLLNSNTVRISITASDGINSTTVSWRVVEYTVIGGSDDMFFPF